MFSSDDEEDAAATSVASSASSLPLHLVLPVTRHGSD